MVSTNPNRRRRVTFECLLVGLSLIDICAGILSEYVPDCAKPGVHFGAGVGAIAGGATTMAALTGTGVGGLSLLTCPTLAVNSIIGTGGALLGGPMATLGGVAAGMIMGSIAGASTNGFVHCRRLEIKEAKRATKFYIDHHPDGYKLQGLKQSYEQFFQPQSKFQYREPLYYRLKPKPTISYDAPKPYHPPISHSYQPPVSSSDDSVSVHHHHIRHDNEEEDHHDHHGGHPSISSSSDSLILSSVTPVSSPPVEASPSSESDSSLSSTSGTTSSSGDASSSGSSSPIGNQLIDPESLRQELLNVVKLTLRDVIKSSDPVTTSTKTVATTSQDLARSPNKYKNRWKWSGSEQLDEEEGSSLSSDEIDEVMLKDLSELHHGKHSHRHLFLPIMPRFQNQEFRPSQIHGPIPFHPYKAQQSNVMVREQNFNSLPFQSHSNPPDLFSYFQRLPKTQQFLEVKIPPTFPNE